MTRLALLLAALPLAGCSIVTHTFGTIDIHAPEAPAAVHSTTSTTLGDRLPQLHYDACIELAVNSTACPRTAATFEQPVDIGTPLVIDRCVEHAVEQSEKDCVYSVVVP